MYCCWAFASEIFSIRQNSIYLKPWATHVLLSRGHCSWFPRLPWFLRWALAALFTHTGLHGFVYISALPCRLWIPGGQDHILFIFCYLTSFLGSGTWEALHKYLMTLSRGNAEDPLYIGNIFYILPEICEATITSAAPLANIDCVCYILGSWGLLTVEKQRNLASLDFNWIILFQRPVSFVESRGRVLLFQLLCVWKFSSWNSEKEKFN